MGAGLGYGVVHHGSRKQYEVQNTLITSAVFAVAVMGAMSLHYSLMDEQKVEIMSKLTRQWIEDPENQNTVMKLGAPSSDKDLSIAPEKVGSLSLELDQETRWIYPTFRKRYIRPEASADQASSSHLTWEIVRPGFFVNRETHPWYFEKSESGNEKPQH